MGADGGIEWVTLRPGVSPSALWELVAPWGDLLTELGSGVKWEGRTQALCTLGPQRVGSGYGDDIPGYGWGMFAEWATDLKRAVDDFRGLPEGASFQDYLDEVDTRPAWAPKAWNADALEVWVGCLRRAPEAFRQGDITSWLQRLGATVCTTVVDVRAGALVVGVWVERMETWT